MRSVDLDTIASRLPLVPGVHGRDEFPVSAVLVALVDGPGGLSFLFEERSAGIRQGGEICFPGGMVDGCLDATTLDTALRETEEELGIPGSRVRVLGRLDTIVAPFGTIVEAHVGFVDADPRELSPCLGEVARAFSVPVAWFAEHPPETHRMLVRMYAEGTDPDSGGNIVYLPVRELGLPERYLEPWGNRTQNVYVYRTPEGIVWGLTARLVRDFVAKACW